MPASCGWVRQPQNNRSRGRQAEPYPTAPLPDLSGLETYVTFCGMVGLRATVLGRLGWKPSPHPRAHALSYPPPAIYWLGLRLTKLARAEVVVISPELRPELESVAAEIHRRPYEAGDLEGAYLAFVATDARDVNAAVVEEAKERGIPVNVRRLRGAEHLTEVEEVLLVGGALRKRRLAPSLRERLGGQGYHADNATNHTERGAKCQ